MNYQDLKTRQRLERRAHPPNLALRVHRALSWLNRAEQLAEDRDELAWIFCRCDTVSPP
jgi:hypothetical protein